MILLLIFGMNIGELLTFLGIIASAIGGLLWINIELTKLKDKINEIDVRINKDEELVVETAKILKATTIETARILSDTTTDTVRYLAKTTKETADMLSINDDKGYNKNNERLNKLENKIDHVISTVNDIKISLAKQ